ncbi:hypothetical protein O0I10_009538 [Lichtheimia ornata]|uniref:Zn(2)-C6 fungal-type domain-containing protein n=1 Tax=Lichtheimia ornata TaxID=688661 RepID=A0AAD7XYM4_9FUNG|nr:uncharacterized protein O0I10_009538 [Lichtheimia ornata]KAJ8654817.1 hypothetical protein O0I10_009538 [Lichtheimia ornata]
MQPNSDKQPLPSSTMNDNNTRTPGNGQAVLRIPINISGLEQQQTTTTTRADDLNAQGRPKRKQVKNACVNCQKACKKCDDGRPCQRCIRYNLQDTCVNSMRKERRKGVKRGPYKKRGDEGGSSTGYDLPVGSSYSSHPPMAQYTPYATMAFQEALNGQPAPSQFMAPYTNPPTMHPGYNHMLSYQAVMSMISPGSTSNMYHPSSSYYYQQPAATAAAPENGKDNHPQQQSSTTASSITTSDGDQDDETSKLNLLSQLCTAALDRLSQTNDQQEGEATHNPSNNNNGTAKDNQ